MEDFLKENKSIILTGIIVIIALLFITWIFARPVSDETQKILDNAKIVSDNMFPTP